MKQFIMQFSQPLVTSFLWGRGWVGPSNLTPLGSFLKHNQSAGPSNKFHSRIKVQVKL
jgi:hypothetical protein